jgi:DNA-directed RNA polymerase specialized sigma24 family protein
MNVHISYKVNKTPDLEKDINHAIEKLRKRLQAFRPELVHLKGTVEHNSTREGFVVSLNLRLPSGQMASQESAPTVSAAVKGASEELLQQLNKHKALLRNSHNWPRWRRGANAPAEPQVPFEETVAAVQPNTVSSDDVRSYVNANLGRLELYIEREISFREAADQLAPESVSKEEVIDEVVARALGDGADKPERLALEPWLYRLAIQALNEFATRSEEDTSSVSLDQSVRRPEPRGSYESRLQFHQPDEMLTAESTIADTRIATPEAVAYSDEMITVVQFALEGAHPVDREAFILYAIEGFSVEEIAAITDRKPELVRASIDKARDHVRRAPGMANRFKDKLLQHTTTR